MTDPVIAALAGKQARRAALHRSLGGVPDSSGTPEPEPAELPVVGFDGGARTGQPPIVAKPTEAEFLSGVLQDARRGSRPAPRW